MKAVSIPNPIEGLPPALWARAAAAPRRVVLLDYDGTLAPYTAARRRALPLPAARDALERLARSRGTTAGVVSGRPLSELRRLLGPLPLLLVGEHGWEEGSAAGEICTHAVSPRAAKNLREAVAAAADFEALLERKRCSVVLHTRGLPGTEARAIERACGVAWEALAAASGLRLDRIDGGLELRAVGRDKGSAVREILARAGSDAFPVYIGDDETDEDAFRAVAAAGLGIRVGRSDVPTEAAGRLPSCEAVASFLDRWWRRIEGGTEEPAERA